MFRKAFEFSDHAGPVYTLSGKNGQLFSGSGDRMIANWDLIHKMQLPNAIRVDQAMYSLLFDPQASLLHLGSANGNLHVIDLKEKKEIRNIQLHEFGIYHILLSNEGQFLWIAGGDGVLSIWTYPHLELVKRVKLSTKKLRCITELRDQDSIFVGCGEGLIHEFKRSLEHVSSFPAHEGSVYCILHHEQKDLLISGGRDALIKFWKRSEKKWEAFRAIPAHNYAVYDLVETPIGFASASRDKSVKIWDKNSFDLIQRIDLQKGGHRKSVNKLHWDQVAQLLISTGDDQKIIAWELS